MQPQSQPQGHHGPFTDADIQQVMADTGFPYDKVCADIDKTHARSPEELYPQIYAGEGIQPPQQQGETVAPGTVQGDPNSLRAQAQAAMSGKQAQAQPEQVAEQGEGESAQSPQAESAEGEDTIPADLAQAMHTAMAPQHAAHRRRAGVSRATPAASGPSWREQQMKEY